MKKNILKKASVGIALGIALGLTLLPFLALADVGTVPGPIITSPTQIVRLLNNVLTFLATSVMIIALIMLLYAAILYLTAGSSETIHTKAKSVLIYAIVGIVIGILAFSVRPFIQNFFMTG